MNKTKGLKTRGLIGLLCVLASFEAWAADWTSIVDDKNSEVLVDMDSFNESDGYPFITAKVKFKSLQTYHLNQTKFAYIAKIYTPTFNCTLHTVKISPIDFYNEKNTIVGTEKVNATFKPIATDSIDKQLEGLTCQVHRMLGGQ